MARGYAGAFGRRVNTWYLWLALCVLFIAPFVPWRRRPTLLHLDLVMLLGFSVSLAFFNHAAIGLSVPLVYPFLLYLLARMLLLAFGRGVPRAPLRTVVPASWLAVATVFLMAFRIGLNILNSNVIDVGYAGVIGADKIIHGHALYGHWPSDNLYGDTYGPVSYYLYLPFRWFFGWSGSWDSLPAAHGAAIFFDLAVVAGLIVLGRRLRGNSLAALLAYAWAAYPFTLYAMNSNTNDALVPALLVGALLVITSAPGRGAVAALAGLTKFAPFALAPLLLRGTGDRPRPRSIAAYVLSFGATAVAIMFYVLLKHNLHAFWQDSIAYQSNRVTPFSVWGLWGGLGPEQHLLQGMAVGLAIVVAFYPARRGVVEVAALAAAVLIALQLTVNYWLYPYIVWFFPLVMVALFASHPDRRARLESTWPSAAVREPGPPAPAPPASAAPAADPDSDPDPHHAGPVEIIPLWGAQARHISVLHGQLDAELPSPRRRTVPRRAHGQPGQPGPGAAGSSTWSMACARSGCADAVIITALSQGFSVEVSKRIGILVDMASTASSRLTPITPSRGPVMPTSVM
jgi:hypothetical protein